MNTLYFASPWFLAGVATLLIPFLLLLTRAKSFRVTHFSSTMFLRDITQRASNVIQWKKLLLLAVRLSALFLLALAFSLPFFNRYQGFLSEGAHKHVIFILDNSYSMGYRENGKTLFETAKKKITEKSKEKGRAVYSLYLFNRDLESYFIKTKEEGSFQTALREAKISSFGTDFTAVFSSMKEMIAPDPSMKTKIFIVSDFFGRDEKIQGELKSLVAGFSKSFEVETVSIQPSVYTNFELQDFVAPARFFLPGEEEEIKIKYESWGMAGKEVALKLEVDHGKVQTDKITIPQSGKGTHAFKFRFPAPGFFPVKVSVQDDALMADNERYFLAQAHEPLRILILEDQEYVYPFDSPNFYFTQVLESVAPQGSGKLWVSLAKSTPAAMASLDLSGYGLIVMADLTNFETGALTQLRSYARAGGTILIAAGKNFELKNYTQPYLSQLTGGSFGAVEKPATPADFFHPHFVEYGHPIFSVFNLGKKGDLSRVPFKSYVPFIPAETTDYRVLMWFESKAPAFVEVARDKGKVFIWTSSLNPDWNDFPKNLLFVPFVFEFLKYSAMGHDPASQNLTAGDNIKLEFSKESIFHPLTVKMPNGEKTTFFYDAKLKTPLLKAEQPGFYEWTRTENETAFREWAVVNMASRESGPEYPVIGMADKNKKSATANVNAQVTGLSKKYFTYLPLIYMVMGLLLIEAWLANRAYKPQWV